MRITEVINVLLDLVVTIFQKVDAKFQEMVEDIIVHFCVLVIRQHSKEHLRGFILIQHVLNLFSVLLLILGLDHLDEDLKSQHHGLSFSFVSKSILEILYKLLDDVFRI